MKTRPSVHLGAFASLIALVALLSGCSHKSQQSANAAQARADANTGTAIMNAQVAAAQQLFGGSKPTSTHVAHHKVLPPP